MTPSYSATLLVCLPRNLPTRARTRPLGSSTTAPAPAGPGFPRAAPSLKTRTRLPSAPALRSRPGSSFCAAARSLGAAPSFRAASRSRRTASWRSMPRSSQAASSDPCSAMASRSCAGVALKLPLPRFRTRRDR